MPSARLKLVKLAAAASSSPFCSNITRTCFANPVKNARLGCEVFESGKCNETISECSVQPRELAVAALHQIPLPPQLHHFSSKSNWLCHYRRWLKNSKAVWLQRLQHQRSILQFFSVERCAGPRRAPRSRASNPQPKPALKNSTLEVYGARAATFKAPRCCVITELRQTQLFQKQK
jgi:hypothetical protein